MVTILLAVYNGEKYLKEQIESLLNQTVNDIKIVIRDDGSSDNSVGIINDFYTRFPDKISVITGEPTGSAKQNFAVLLSSCDDDYIMFCDQDDVWYPDKVEKTLSVMKRVESGNKDLPVLIHTNLAVVDHELNLISDSFFDFQKLCFEMPLSQLLVQNNVTGCTVMMNRALKNKCGDIPSECIMHDWWLSLVATAFGRVECIKEATMRYRQHSGNQVGAKASYGLAFIKRKLATLGEVRKNYNATYAQAKAFLKNFGKDLEPNQYELLKKYCEIPNMCKFKRIKTINKYGFKKCTRLRLIGQYILM